MGKSNQQFMDLNRETAMRLWNKSFGKDTKAVDFAGRTIAKGAYNDRNSEFGWNVDHVLPQSRGGVTADHNLVCCHISTNDEKADKFPCFTANGIAFEIVKVQNHYEIKTKSDIKADEPTNFFDSASGLRFFKSLKKIQGKRRFVGTVFIKLHRLTNTAVIDFIDCLLEKEYISVEGDCTSNDDVVIIARNNYMPLQEDTDELLDQCVLINTYFSNYFKPIGCVESFDIYFRLDDFDNNFLMYQELDDIQCPNKAPASSLLYQMKMSYQAYHDSLFISDLVLKNTEAGEKVSKQENSEYTQYPFVFTKLSENLKKEVSGK